MDISEAAKLSLAVAGGAGVITFWVNSIVDSIDNVARAYRERTKVREEHFRVTRQDVQDREYRAHVAARGMAPRRVTDDSGLSPSATELLGKFDAQGRR